MPQRLHTAIMRALKLAERPEASKSLAESTSHARDGALGTRQQRQDRSVSLVSLLNRQIADAQLRLRGLRDLAERQAQMRLIEDLNLHLQRELVPVRVCS